MQPQTAIQQVALAYAATLFPGRVEIHRHALSVDGRRVLVRVASVHQSRHIIRRAGREYHYRYPMFSWNLHSHNRLVEAPDHWVLIGVSNGTMRTWLVPGNQLRAKTVALMVSRKGGRERAVLDRYRLA